MPIVMGSDVSERLETVLGPSGALINVVLLEADVGILREQLRSLPRRNVRPQLRAVGSLWALLRRRSASPGFSC